MEYGEKGVGGSWDIEGKTGNLGKCGKEQNDMEMQQEKFLNIIGKNETVE